MRVALAREQHMSMVDTELLGFEMCYAEFELADIVHDTNWYERSKDIFRTLLPNDDSASEEKAQAHATSLLFAIKMVLTNLLQHLHATTTAPDQNNTLLLARNVSAMREAVRNVLNAYFDSEQGGYACPLFSEEEEEED